RRGQQTDERAERIFIVRIERERFANFTERVRAELLFFWVTPRPHFLSAFRMFFVLLRCRRAFAWFCGGIVCFENLLRCFFCGLRVLTRAFSTKLEIAIAIEIRLDRLAKLHRRREAIGGLKSRAFYT